MKVCFFARVSNRAQLPETFYGRDIGLLEELGHEVSVATRMREISPRAELIFGWWFGSGVRALIAAQILRRPCLMVGDAEGGVIAAHRRRHERLLIDYCLRHASSVVVLSRHDLDVLRPMGLRNVHLVRPGMALAPHRPEVAQRDPIVLTVGTVGMGQGSRRRLDSLVRAIVLVRRRRPDLTLHLAGAPGPGHEELRGLIRTLGVEPYVRMHGRVSFAARDELYRRALVLAHPVIYEDLAVAPLEAMGQGLPVITTPCALTREVAGTSALYCDSSSPDEIAARIVTLVEDPALWERCSSAGYARIGESYSREQRRSRLREVIDLTLAGYREPAANRDVQSLRSGGSQVR